MSDRLSELYSVLKEPLRQKILLKLGQSDNFDFDSLMKSLKLTEPSNLDNQLSVLLATKVEGEHLVAKKKLAINSPKKGVMS